MSNVQIEFDDMLLLPKTVAVDKLIEHLSAGDIIVARFMSSSIADLCFKYSDNVYPSMACCLSGEPQTISCHDLEGIKGTLRIWRQMSFRFYVLSPQTLPIYQTVKSNWVPESNEGDWITFVDGDEEPHC